VPMAGRACTAVPQGVQSFRLHAIEGLLSSRASSSLAGKTTVAIAADNVRARWLKLGGGSSESYSSLAGSSGSASGTTGSSAVRARVPACRQWQRPEPVYYSLRRVATGIPRPGSSEDFDLVGRAPSLGGTYMPMTQAGQLPMLPEVAAATWRELRRAQMAADDFEIFI